MPMLPIIGHLSMIHTNMFAAGFAVLCIEGLEASTAEGPSVLHDVSLPTEDSLTLEATEMLHVPVAAFSLCALVCKNDLVTR